MARAIDADELEMFPYSEGAGTEEQISEWIEQAGLSEEDTADRARLLCWKVIEGYINVVKTQPTLTPPNEWVEALEAINNAAVAYIEGGPYENDLPGMEFAVEIDRLSRDFVRPPNEPLTPEQLREMDGEPVWFENMSGGRWCIVYADYRCLIGKSFGVTFEEIERTGRVYRRPPEGEA